MEGCSHKDRKIKVAAKDLLVMCTRCKQLVHSRKRVLSSSVYAVARIPLRAKNKFDFEIQYMGKAGGYGTTYVYFNVPSFHWDAFLRAKSKGEYVAQLIKPKFKFAIVK